MIEPVEIEFLLKNVNSAQVTEQMKKDVAGVGETTQRTAERVSASLNNQAANYNRASSGAAQFAKVNNQLSFSIQQVARELPNAAISSQIFFMAISNNLPILADNLRNARLEYARAKSKGEESIPVWKQVTGSIFSWQTALVAGITIMTVWGQDIVKGISNLFKFRNEVGLTKDEVKSLNDSFTKNAGNDLGKLKTMFDQLDNAKRGTAEWYAAKKDIIDQFGPYLRGMDAEIASLNNQSKAYEALSKSILKAAKDKALIETNSKLATDFLTKSNESYDIIEENFIKKFGANLGKLRFGMLKNQLESGQGLTYEMQRYVDEFNRKTQRVVGVSTTGSPQFSGEYVVNNVADAINAYTKAKNEFDQKTKDALNRLGSNTTTTEVKNTVQVIEERIQQLKNEQKQVSENSAQWDDYQKRIKELELKKEAITGKEIKSLERQISDVEEKMLSATGKELSYLSAKLVLLNKELELRKWIAYEAVAFQKGDATQADRDAVKRGGNYKPLTPVGKSTIDQKGVLGTDTKGRLVEITAVDKTGPTFKKVTAEYDKLNKFQKEKAKDANRLQEKLDEDNLKRKEDFYKKLIDYSRQYTGELIDQLGLSEDQNKELQGLSDTIFNLAKGDFLAAGFSYLSTITTAFIQSFQKASLSEMIDNITSSISTMLDSLNSVSDSANNLGIRDITSELSLLQNQILSLGDVTMKLNDSTLSYEDQVKKFYDDIEKTQGGILRGVDAQKMFALIQQIESGYGTTLAEIDKTISSLYEKLLNPLLTDKQRENIQKVIDSYSAIKDQIESMTQEVIGTSIADLAASLSDAIISGADSWDVWEQKANDVIQNVIAKQLKSELLTAPVTNAVNLLVKNSTDGLSTDEAKQFQEAIKAIYSEVAPAYQSAIDALKSVGIDLSSSKSSSSALTGISASATEDTVSALVGQIMAMRIDIKDAVKMAAQGQDDRGLFLKYTKQIAENTSHNIRLIKIDEGIAEMNKTLKDRL